MAESKRLASLCLEGSVYVCRARGVGVQMRVAYWLAESKLLGSGSHGEMASREQVVSAGLRAGKPSRSEQ